jgi:peptide/nickel transport system substrate-binding protein
MTGPDEISRRRFLQQGAMAGSSLSALGALVACDSGTGEGTPSPLPTQPSGATGTTGPVTGGTLRIGMTSGGTAETLDPSLFIASSDVARGLNIWDRLVRLDENLAPELELAESIEPNDDATEWTFRLKSDVVWHDGSPLTADDLLFTMRRIAAPDSVSAGAGSFRLFKLKEAQKLDDLTLRVPLERPFASVPVMFIDFFAVILRDGTETFEQPVGTGPFVLESFTPGESSSFTRNANYWREGQPYVDELELRSIVDVNTRLQGVTGGQLDATDGLNATLAREVESGGRATVLAGVGPITSPFVMATNQPVFRDARVRQAMRLLVDREAIVQNIFGDYGDLGNDLLMKGLPFYADDLPQRQPDVDQARSLLRAAGAEDLEVPLTTAAVVAGWVESATIFAQQAQEAGVKVTVDERPTDSYWSDAYMSTPFFMTTWNPVPLPTWSSQALLPGGVWNETAWEQPGFEDLVLSAQAELDPGKAEDKWHQVQQILYDEGGYIVWGFQPWLDAVSTRVQGAVGNGWQPLGSFGFREWWLD